MQAFFVYVTASSEAEALLISRTVVSERLAACANLLGPVKSVYWWDGKICEGAEVALVLKTAEEQKTKLIHRIKQLHAYDCPGITCLPIADGNPDFLAWIREETIDSQR